MKLKSLRVGVDSKGRKLELEESWGGWGGVGGRRVEVKKRNEIKGFQSYGKKNVRWLGAYSFEGVHCTRAEIRVFP